MRKHLQTCEDRQLSHWIRIVDASDVEQLAAGAVGSRDEDVVGRFNRSHKHRLCLGEFRLRLRVNEIDVSATNNQLLVLVVVATKFEQRADMCLGDMVFPYVSGFHLDTTWFARQSLRKLATILMQSAAIQGSTKGRVLLAWDNLETFHAGDDGLGIAVVAPESKE